MRVLIPALFALHACLATAQCPFNLFVNGDLNGTEGEFTIATDWNVAEGTPDLNDHIGPLNTTPDYAWITQPTASPTGGTWQNIGPPEAISQEVTTMVGVTYFICLDHAWQPIINVPAEYPFLGPFGVDVFANGELIFSTPFAPEANEWETTCGSFVADATTTEIMFHGAPTEEAYGAIDNLCMYYEGKTGLPEQDREAARFFPNPAHDDVRLNINTTMQSAIAFSSDGRSTPLPVSGSTANTATLAAGAYVVECSFSNDTLPLRLPLLVVRGTP